MEPIPDALLASAPDPVTVVDIRAGVRLAFIAALQYLPPLRRSVLILRDVLNLPAAQTAHVLGTTTAAVNSALPRARAQIARISPVAEEVTEPSAPHRRALLNRYVAAFHNADIAALVALMRNDIALEMPPRLEWFRGQRAVAEFFATRVLRTPGQFQMVATAANRQPAFVTYQRDGDTYQLHAVQVLTLDTGRIAHIAVFLEPSVCALFGNAASPVPP